MATSSRMLTLLSLLQARRDWPGQLLAERLGISDRTVRRDVDRLRELGYRIQATKGPDGGYRLDAGTELPPLLFDDEQAVVLAVALQQVAVAGTAFEEAGARALATVRQVLPSRLRHRVDGLRFTAVAAAGASPSAALDLDVLTEVSRTTMAHEVLRFDYASPTGEASPGEASPERGMHAPRRVEPHHVVSRGGRWYLVAWDLERDDWRVFRVDRITRPVSTRLGFVPRELPGGDVATFVEARFKGSSGVDQWPCRGSVELAVGASVVSPYLAGDTVVDLGEGRCRLTLGAWSWAGLAARFGQLDADVSKVEPVELADAFAALAVRFAAAAG
ncbi:helix-turn-helix transcriptional regulator [Frondihabitans cladoniiphilus]|uniref:WYL domain-containing protein n=1 Tax=Frondihabitans cladoniiphilus TaxID=715785 RepID=A0ABP8VNP1_9MICO